MVIQTTVGGLIRNKHYLSNAGAYAFTIPFLYNVHYKVVHASSCRINIIIIRTNLVLTTYHTCVFIYYRKVDREFEINPRNHIHNPLYTFDYVPSNTLIGAPNSQPTTPHEYDYVQVREPLARRNGATNNNSIGQPSTNNYLHENQTRMSIQNESALPLHYETMATYGNRIANRVDTTSPPR